MAVHDYHDALPGYHPDQILHDGCGECEYRAESVERALAHMDEDRFIRAWRRAADQFAFKSPSGSSGGPRAVAEMPVLTALWGVQLHLYRLVGLHYGELPQ